MAIYAASALAPERNTSCHQSGQDASGLVHLGGTSPHPHSRWSAGSTSSRIDDKLEWLAHTSVVLPMYLILWTAQFSFAIPALSVQAPGL